MAAHDALATRTGETKRVGVRDMFSEIAETYDALNSVMSLRLHHRWRAAAVRALDLRPGDSTLDVCCGTGDFMFPLRKAIGASGSVFGVDSCLPMLKIAARKGAPGSLALGDACALPVATGSLNAVTVGWGLRNVVDVRAAHREIRRALAPRGKFVSIDMAVPRSEFMRAVSRAACQGVLARIGGVVGHAQAYEYLHESARLFMSREELAKSMADSGFVDIGWRDLAFGNLCMHWGTAA